MSTFIKKDVIFILVYERNRRNKDKVIEELKMRGFNLYYNKNVFRLFGKEFVKNNNKRL